MKTMNHDVLIIGAGPIGSYTGFLLSKQGLRVGIFEKSSAIGQNVNCTGIVSQDCLEKVNISAEAVVRPINAIKAISPAGNFFRYQSAKPLAYVVNRTQFDHGINMMAAREGTAVYLNSKVEDVHITDDAFQVTVTSEGRRSAYHSAIGVIATGFDVKTFDGVFQRPSYFLYGAQTDVSIKDVSDVEVYFGERIAPNSFGWVVPTDERHAKIGLIVKSRPVDYLRRFMESQPIAERLVASQEPIKCSPIPFRSIQKSFGKRMLVVGEAAGQVKSTTGGGIYFGLLCAEIAANIIAKAVKKSDYSEGCLMEYDTTWRQRLEPEIKAGNILRKIFNKLSDNQIDYLMELAKKDGVLPFIQKAHFDWHKDLITYLIRSLIQKKLFKK
jgi:geranylgeranyl reductase family protein